jgi:uncharacterized protein YfiM (DUF2279 family)
LHLSHRFDRDNPFGLLFGADQQCQNGRQRRFRLTGELSLAENQQCAFMSRKEGQNFLVGSGGLLGQ